MTNNTFNINASKQGSRALIRITGTIGLDILADTFRSQVDAISGQGVKDAHIYINSPGGSCFDAAEIINIIQSAFKGDITGEGGALVASAATYIALHCKSFTMPQNGMFMIHKPSGSISGDSNTLKSYTKLMSDIEAQYYNAYKSRIKDINSLDDNWNRGDWWMTAEEAKANGFITGITGKTEIDSRTAYLISACGCPKAMLSGQDSDPIARINEALGLPVNSGVDRTLETIAAIRGEETPEKAIEKAIKIGALKEFEKDEFMTIARLDPQAWSSLLHKRIENNKKDFEDRIDKIINSSILEKRITAESRVRERWKRLLTADFEAAKASLEAILTVKKVEINPPRSGAYFGKENRSKWTLDDYRKNDPEALRKNPRLYEELLEKENLNNN